MSHLSARLEQESYFLKRVVRFFRDLGSIGLNNALRSIDFLFEVLVINSYDIPKILREALRFIDLFILYLPICTILIYEALFCDNLSNLLFIFQS